MVLHPRRQPFFLLYIHHSKPAAQVSSLARLVSKQGIYLTAIHSPQYGKHISVQHVWFFYTDLCSLLIQGSVMFFQQAFHCYFHTVSGFKSVASQMLLHLFLTLKKHSDHN